MADITDRSGYGPLPGLPTIWNTAILSTTPTLVTLPTTGLRPERVIGQVVKLTILNAHATNAVAYTWVKRAPDGTSVAPSITADTAATGGILLIPAVPSHTLSLPADVDVYAVASAGSTTAQAASTLFV